MDLDVTMYISVVITGERDGFTENSIYVPHQKKQISVKVPNCIDKDSMLRLKKLGNIGANGDKGDLLIKFNSIKYNNTNTNASDFQRKVVYDGEIHKCPNCGEVINSFVSICPACSFELGGKPVSPVLQEFIDKVNKFDRLIADCPPNKNGWSTWDESKRLGWVILNCILLCVPLVLYLVLPLVFIKSTPKLTSEEKQLSSLIENFTFPNDRESILAALVYAKEKVDFISKEKIDRKSAYWMRLWCAKAEQLKQKADILFPNDIIVNNTYAEIVSDNEKVKRTIKTKILGSLCFLAAVIVCALIIYGVIYNTIISGQEKILTTMNVKNFTFDLYDYWDEEGSKKNYLQYYAEKGDKVVMLSISYPEETDDDYDVSFKGLEADNDNMVEAIEEVFTDGNVVNSQEFESDYGVKGILYHFTFNQKIDWFTNADGNGYCFCFPSEKDRRWFYVVFVHTNNVSSDEYKDDYMHMLASIKEN